MAKKLGERLVEAGITTPEAVESALTHQRVTGHKLGDCLVETGLVAEQPLLRFLATEFNTRFVSTEKLARAKINSDVLDRIPVRMAETQLFLPLALDPEARVLSVVASEPQNRALMEEIAVVAGVSEVFPYVGLRSAIAAAIRKHYYGDSTAFVSPRETGAVRADVSAMARAYESGFTDPALSVRTDGSGSRSKRSSQARYVSGLRDSLGRGLLDNDYVETLRVMVGLLESGRGERKGHSAQLARQSAQVARRMALPPREVACVAMAAYLHDLGKPAERHFTLSSNDLQPGWKEEAKGFARTPVQLLESVHLPVQVNGILAQLYEAFDGSGTPQGAKGEDIAAGARIIAAVDCYLDLTKNPANGFNRLLNKDEALRHLQENAGRLFDPAVVELVARVHSGELLRQRIHAEGCQVVVADPDAGRLHTLLAAITRQGLVAQAVSTLEGVYDAAFSGESDVIVLNLGFGPNELLSLLASLKQQPETAGIPVLVVGDPDPAVAERLLQTGTPCAPLVTDAVTLAEQVDSLYQFRRAHGGPGKLVRGSFDELSVEEVLKLLTGGRKSGRLALREDAQEGYIHVERGRVIYASFDGHQGESGLRAMMGLNKADFAYDPESLLLEPPQQDQELDRVVRDFAKVSQPEV